MKEIKTFKNTLLNRTEYVVSYEACGVTLQKDKIRNDIVKKYDVKPELVVINKVTTFFKSDINEVDFYIYEDMETLTKLVPKHIKKRNGIVEEKEVKTEEKAEK